MTLASGLLPALVAMAGSVVDADDPGALQNKDGGDCAHHTASAHKQCRAEGTAHSLQKCDMQKD